MLVVSENAGNGRSYGDASSLEVGQYVAYTLYKVRPEWRRLPVEEREAAKDAFAEMIDEFAPRFDTLNTYSTTGVRPETATSSSGRSPSATRTSASSARR